MRLAIIGDLHFFDHQLVQGNEELLLAKERFYENFLEIFFEMEADVHISLGDLTHMGLEEEFEHVYRHIRNSGVSFRHILGNHDAYELPKSKIQSLMDHPLNDVLETEDALFVFVDSTREMDPQDYSGHFKADQLDWLETQMHASPSKPIFVFAHHPLYNTTATSTDEKMHMDLAIDMRAILRQRQGTGFYFNDHNHVHSIAREEQWSFIQTAACMCHPSIRLVEIDKSEVRTRVVAVEDREIVEAARILYDKLPQYHRPLQAQGQEADRDQIMLL
ncbi:metallophosphoesterase [Paenibacillus doosanensis]|uniref:metallophosphoesterase family protein n=1 Tax=Paenibacillus doosanensis TaxID=1229154 RepID=UPI00217FE99C|nr:metallophosphoesterase [Paenibacillus doosanensis]MCS7459857.1 metallophosphoesterase [Paenibacillus doosanensis]